MAGKWIEVAGLVFWEEKHPTGYALEVNLSGYHPHMSVHMLTVPDAERLATALQDWANLMRTGGHYKEVGE